MICWRCGADAETVTECGHEVPVCQDCAESSEVWRRDDFVSLCRECLVYEYQDEPASGDAYQRRWLDGRS